MKRYTVYLCAARSWDHSELAAENEAVGGNGEDADEVGSHAHAVPLAELLVDGLQLAAGDCLLVVAAETGVDKLPSLVLQLVAQWREPRPVDGTAGGAGQQEPETDARNRVGGGGANHHGG